MKLIDLTGNWHMAEAGSAKSYPAIIPGTVAGTLLTHAQIPHPYEEDNEPKILSIFEKDYCFTREFIVNTEALGYDKLVLRCDGLDTLADIFLNGQLLAKTNNMHRSYQFECKQALVCGNNLLEIRFHSPVRYVKENPSRLGKPFSVLRKAACMFGWDWGLNLPDSGIWRDICIEAFDEAKIDHIHMLQEHKNGQVLLNITPHSEVWGTDLSIRTELAAPDGETLFSETKSAGANHFQIEIARPQLWWPVGYGSQPLYTVTVTLLKAEKILDISQKQIGLRSFVHSRAPKETGSEYSFYINGKPIYFRGENMIINDALIAQTQANDWERLVSTAVKSNLNGLRIWGGAYYPPDIFYDLCDRAGIMLFQDFMFACSFYEINEEFCANVALEAEQNIKRIAHHPAISLYCGNNEIDAMYTVANSTEPETAALRKLFGSGEAPLPEAVRNYIWETYRRIFLDILPGICARWAPDSGYVHSSPSVREPGKSSSFFNYLYDGDMHYYLQYHNNAPYSFIRNVRSRFITEIGFQSYPSMKTIAMFAGEADQRPDSAIMYAHQKCKNGNQAIEEYMARDYGVPALFRDYVYTSQLQAGEIMAYTTEHFRRDNTYNRGVILWQLNDCWPVVSWSGMDYYGRWKALQYYIKRFFAPVLVSAKEDGAAMELWVCNETPAAFTGTLHWWLRNNLGEVIAYEKTEVNVDAGISERLCQLDFSGILTDDMKKEVYFEYVLEHQSGIVGQGTKLFCLPRDYAFKTPHIKITATETKECYVLELSTDCYTKGLMLDTNIGDCIFSDNWFDMTAGTGKKIVIDKKDVTGISSLAELEDALFTLCLNEVLLRSGVR